jgi:hypothetical protein
MNKLSNVDVLALKQALVKLGIYNHVIEFALSSGQIQRVFNAFAKRKNCYVSQVDKVSKSKIMTELKFSTLSNAESSIMPVAADKTPMEITSPIPVPVTAAAIPVTCNASSEELPLVDKIPSVVSPVKAKSKGSAKEIAEVSVRKGRGKSKKIRPTQSSFTLKINDDDLVELEDMAISEGVPMAHLIRKAITVFLKGHRSGMR